MKKKLKVSFYMKSGNVIYIKFDEFRISRLSGNDKRSMTFSGEEKEFTIDIREIECCIIESINNA